MKHYLRVLFQSNNFMIDSKKCSMCLVEKPFSAFYKQVGRENNITSQCRGCRKNTATKWRNTPSGRLRTRSAYLKRTYGVDLVTVTQMTREQENLCLICKVSFNESEPHVDHCHKTGVVRGILCERCNLAIGLSLNSPTVCEAAMQYLLRK